MDDINPSGPHSIGGIADPDLPTMTQESGTETTEKNNASQQKIPKRRTKTGCLTCRQRRIKCGEEKPVCNNCIKSKRECKGYAQRLIFKDPVGISGSSHGGHALHHSTPAAGPHGYHAPAFSQPRPPGPQPPVLAPRPTVFPTEGQTTLSGGVKSSPPGPLLHGNHSGHPSTAMPGASMGDPDMPQGWLQPPNTNFNVHQAYHMDESNRTTPGQIQAYSQFTPASRGSLQEQDPSEQPSYPAASHGVTYAEDDDFFGVESDDEPEAQVVTQNFNQLSLIMASANRDDGPPRSFTTYLNEPNVLASYQPTPGSSLNNPKTARIFLHFIHSTGPSISIFERHPIDPSTMFGAPVPTAQQGLWTYTLPFKALEHQALLQAILALSSLHIAYLQEAPPTVSLKHYHYALRRVGVAVGLPMRRKQVGTLAAALLLAYYEVMSADHTKWNSHVAGAVQLLREIDFATITRDLRQHRRRTWAKATSKDFLFGNALLEDDPFSEQESSIDENLIGSILGHAVNYDEFGRVDEGYSRPFNPELTRKDIESFRIQCDLYWWCCKQDIIQSIIGGNPLFMAFSSFGQCPPRAAVGRLDAIYGSADHLWLLLGRLTDFGCRDRRRKLKTFKAAGSEWRPGPELSKFMARFAPRSPSSSSPPPKTPFPSNPSQKNTTGSGNYGPKSTSPSSQSPPMYGMVPSTGPRSLPPAFAETESRRDSSKENEEEENMTYEHAEQEWESILSTFEMFARALGPHFLPLPADSAPPIATPFGPALQYRTQTIAVIWGFYYLGRILLHRLHPCMPPAMMVAAGVAAPTTGEFTQLVGKIAAGIYYPQSFNIETGNLSPTLGSCLIEITVPIFFAAIQYTDRAQRYWIATRLREIRRLTGWRSADAIADGLERAWRTAADQGRGPPYEPPGDGAHQRPVAPTGATRGAADAVTERRFVTVQKPYRTYAKGILGLEEELLSLELEDRL